ncbi:hypothetical protein KRH_22650 [Kocuria rhizophila DC2201]|uniref:Iron-binding zinc finger CDGSH type domain-containing protein n=1 Tax=Kocuria rhizophila (strain ATCC 9341 / DSM 348 / NBRC 103217 / DC2201) TaxID=378753 RepID=B2GIT5_KOCRD|nr:hypothetical protein KRH_22650 [Kocuria rhizophila DC2201]
MPREDAASAEAAPDGQGAAPVSTGRAAEARAEIHGDARTDGDRPSPAGAVEDPVVITPCPNGPLLVRGDVLIAPEPGAEPQKPPRRVVALCRCNMSSIAPFCDGSHKLANFRTRPPRYNIGSPREDADQED